MDVSTASVSQLKEFLKERGVSFEGVVEKNELRELAKKALEAPSTSSAKKDTKTAKPGDKKSKKERKMELEKELLLTPEVAEEPASSMDTSQGALEPVSLNILCSLRKHQLSNGLLHGDYLRYRRYCSRRLLRVRRSLKFTTGKGHYRRARKIVTEKVVTNPKFLLIPLVNAERHWAYGMQLRADNPEGHVRTRRFMVRKLRGAVKNATQLLHLCEKRAEPRTLAEAQAYQAFIEGTYLVEKRKFADALARLAAAKGIYTELAKVGDAEHRAVIADCLEDLQPSIDYCTHCLKRGGGGADADAILLEQKLREGPRLARALAALDASGKGPGAAAATAAAASAAAAAEAAPAASASVTVTWNGAAIPIKGARTQAFVASASSAESRLKAGLSLAEAMGVYDDVVMHYGEALQACRDKKSSEDPALDAYLLFKASEISFRRAKVLLEDVERRLESGIPDANGELARPSDLVKLLDQLLQLRHDMATHAGEAEPVPEIAELRARRCLSLAQSYLADKSFSEALALVDRAKQYGCASLQSQCSTLRSVVIATYNLHEANAAKQIEIEAANLTLRETARRSKYPKLRARLQAFAAGTTTGDPALVDFPPPFQAVPFKPLYFDQAFEHMAYPIAALEKRAKGHTAEASIPEEDPEVEEEEQKPAAAGGGWFSSFWKR